MSRQSFTDNEPVARVPATPFFKLEHSLLCDFLPLLKPGSIAVYVALGVHANGLGKAWPSLATLARYSGYRDEKAVSRLCRNWRNRI